MTAPSQNELSTIEAVIADAKAGKLFILVDDEDRENEGDLCVVAECATADAINFMAKYGRGLICLALTRQRTEALGLTMMDRRNESRHETAFTVSIEAREGVTTGISAHDRAHTIKTAIDPHCNERDILHRVTFSLWWGVMVAHWCGLVIPKRSLILRGRLVITTPLVLFVKL